MSDGYVVAVDGLSALRTLETIPNDIQRRALQAVNRAAERGRASSKRAMLQQIAFGARYLDTDNRFTLDKAKTFEDGATITGRFRPTSLARFVKSGQPGKPSRGVTLQVEKGLATRSRRMFLIRLRAGGELTETNFNLGLAIRLRDGETIDNKKKAIQISRGLYLLYGPSVSQVFSTVADEEAPGVAEFLEQEFLRLMELDRR